MALIMKNMLFAIVFYIFALKIIALPSEKEEKLVGLTDEEPANRRIADSVFHYALLTIAF